MIDKEKFTAALYRYEAAMQEDITEGGDENAEELNAARAALVEILKPAFA